MNFFNYSLVGFTILHHRSYHSHRATRQLTSVTHYTMCRYRKISHSIAQLTAIHAVKSRRKSMLAQPPALLAIYTTRPRNSHQTTNSARPFLYLACLCDSRPKTRQQVAPEPVGKNLKSLFRYFDEIFRPGCIYLSWHKIPVLSSHVKPVLSIVEGFILSKACAERSRKGRIRPPNYFIIRHSLLVPKVSVGVRNSIFPPVRHPSFFLQPMTSHYLQINNSVQFSGLLLASSVPPYAPIFIMSPWGDGSEPTGVSGWPASIHGLVTSSCTQV